MCGAAGAQFNLESLKQRGNEIAGNVGTVASDAIDGVAKRNSTAAAFKPIIYVADEETLLEFSDPFPVVSRVAVTRKDKNRFSLAIGNMARVAAKQKEEGMCWAACVQMALAVSGKTIDQDRLAHEFREGREDKSATFGVMVRALCPELEPQLVGRLVMPIQLIPSSSDTLLEELAAGEPVIVGLWEDPNLPVGHMCVVYHSEYAMRKLSALDAVLAADVQKSASAAPLTDALPVGRAALVNVSLLDPADKEPRGMYAAEFKKQIKFMMSRRMALKLMEDALKAQQESEKPSRSQKKDKRKPFDIKLPFGR
jgi:hypothetical protein